MRHQTTKDIYARLLARRAGHSTARILSEYVGPLMLDMDGQLWWGDSRDDYRPDVTTDSIAVMGSAR
jgi:hypothetical protein